MLPERVDEMLKNYKSYLGRCGHLEVEIAQLKATAARLRAELPSDLSGAGGPQYDGMPRGTAPGNPTERIGLMLASGYTTQDISELEYKIYVLEGEYAEKLTTVRFVDAWLSGLTEKERWLITEQVIEGRYWREITYEWKQIFGEALSRDHLRKLKVRALAKVYMMAS